MFNFAAMNQKKRYKHIIFDLDRTLWDFEASANEVFQEIYSKHKLADQGFPSVDIFVAAYKKHNEYMWSLYRDGKIMKEIMSVKRWFLTLEEFGIENGDLAAKIAEDYIYMSPRRVKLFPYTHEILDYLQPKYELHLLTNGFEEVQQVKLDSAGLRKYFRHMITSERSGYKKPNPRSFKFALETIGATKEECIMIGDDLGVDIMGARGIGMDQIYVNYEAHPHELKNVTFEVNSLKEIEEIL